jgi:hypothetical protein
MCCGNQRAAARAALLAAAPRPAGGAAPAVPAVPSRTASTVFEYTGEGPVEIRGAASGRSYRFAGTGHRIAIDPRDRPALAGVAGLRRVR